MAQDLRSIAVAAREVRDFLRARSREPGGSPSGHELALSSGSTDLAYIQAEADPGAMLVSEWMSRDVATIDSGSAISEAIGLMLRRRVRRLPVMSEAGHLEGIVSRSDVFRICPPDVNPFSVAGADATPIARPVREIMTRSPTVAHADEPIEVAAQKMIDHKVGGLPVVSNSESLVGIVTESDLFRAFTAALGGNQPGLRVTFDVSQGEDVAAFAVDIARRHHLRVHSFATFQRDDRRSAILRLVGAAPAALVDELWRTGHRVQSVLRF